MFNIVLYRFNKRPNSTRVPTSAGTTVPCAMKSISSVITPIVEITDPHMNNEIPLFNYAYIADFGRYYFIEDVRYDIGVWTLFLRCDVLASYKEDILNSRQYVLRSAVSYNPDLVDTFYNTYVDEQNAYAKQSASNDPEEYIPSTDTWQVKSRYFSGSIGDGCFVIGVVGTTLTGVNYYLMPSRVFRRFLDRGFQMVPSDMTDVSQGVAQSLYNYLQYVTYCKWFPVMPSTGNLSQYTAVAEIPCGSQTVDVSATVGSGVPDDCYHIDTNMVLEYREYIDIPRHPSAVTYPYLNLSPYSQYSLYFQPFGCIPLDTTKIYGSDEIRCTWYVDFCTGSVELQLFADNGAMVYTESTQIGVTIPISSLIVDWKVGLGLSALTWIKTQAESITPEGISLAAFGNAHRNMNDVRTAIENTPDQNKNLIDTVMDTISASMGQITTKGQPASFLSYQMGRPFIFAFFMEQTAHDIARFGAPCCQNLRLENLPGFILCGNAIVDYSTGNPTVDEQNAIISMLNSGVYIE